MDRHSDRSDARDEGPAAVVGVDVEVARVEAYFVLEMH